VNQQAAIIGNRMSAQAAAEERARVARELHDTVEQDLAAVAMHLGVIQKHGSPLTPVTEENLAAAFHQVRRSQEDAHCAVWDLRSVTLSERGLPAALEEVLTLAGAGRNLASQCSVHGRERRVSIVVEHHLLRIAQEAITNAVRHAGPQEISVTLAYEDVSITLRVEDDGCGFEAGAQPCTAPRFGLLGMHERAARIGATLSIQSAPGQGTVVEVTLPASTSSACLPTL
jgi:signal transduction histidine kinase